MNKIIIFLSVIIAIHTICPNRTRIVKDRDFQPIQLKYPYTNVFFQKDSNYYYVAGNNNGRLEQALIEKFAPNGDVWTRFYPDEFIFNKLHTTEDYVFAIGCTVEKIAFLIIVNATSGVVLRHQIAHNYCYNSVSASNNYYFITGTKYSGNESQAFVSKYEIKSGRQIYEELYGENNRNIPLICYNKGTHLALISDDEIIVTMALKGEYDNQCVTHIVSLKGLTKQWEVLLVPYHYSEPNAISTYDNLVSVAGKFDFNMQAVNNGERVAACGVAYDSFLITMNISTGKIIHFGSFCDVSEISSLHINNCSFVITGKHKLLRDKIYFATGQLSAVNRTRNRYSINETLVDSSLNSQIFIDNDYITTIIKNNHVYLERYVIRLN